jgi:hypothetical protein
MRDPVLEVEEVQDLRNHLVIAFKDLKTLQMAISTLMVDMSAIRQAVLTTPATKSRYKKRLAGSMKKARPIINQAMRSYDNLIQNVDEHVQPEKRASLGGATTIH